MIEHLEGYNALGEPIFSYTLEKHELEEWARDQTEEQKKLVAWLEKEVW